MSIGDVNSNARGSGARYNDGKVQYDLLPLELVRRWLRDHARGFRGHSFDENERAQEIIYCLGEWQAGDDDALHAAIHLSLADSWDHELELFAPACRVFAYGKRKYKAWNWCKGMEWSAPLGCAIRHCLAILNGERNDKESEQPHMGHVQCNLLMLLLYAKTYREGDDRPIGWLDERVVTTQPA